MFSKVGFSIIVCTYNGSRTLEKMLKHIDELSKSNFNYELIIVDNNSNSETKVLLKNLISYYDSLHIIYLHENEIGKTNALVKGFENVNYEFIVICDDDNYLFENYLINAYNIFNQYKDVGIIGGFGVLPYHEILPNWFEQFKGAWAIGAQKSTTGYVDEKSPSLWGAGLVLRKSVWQDIKNMNFKCFLTGRVNSNVAMAGEDTELCILANLLGYKLYYSDELKFIHDINPNRLNWTYFLQLNIGFSRSQIYFEIYDFVINNKQIDIMLANSYWKNHVMKYVGLFFKDFKYAFFYSGIFFSFVKNKEGYVYGIILRTYFTKIIELIKIKNNLILLTSGDEAY
jgi:glycosyltransferase involved in cell wall biosynthesis